MRASTMLHYDHPAEKWTEALPLGNGELGAMVFGRMDQERIALNLDTLWSGHPYTAADDPDGYETIEAARKLTLDGHAAQAQALIEEQLLSHGNGQCYLPLGELAIEYPSRGRCTQYVRSLDLESAVHSVSAAWQASAGSESVPAAQECFVSAPAGALILRLSCEAELSLQITLRSPHRHVSYVERDALILDGQCPGTIDGERERFDDGPGMGFRIACMVKTDGRVRASGAAITVDHRHETVLILSAADAFNGFARDPAAQGREYKNAALERVRAALETDYDELRRAHIRDYRRFFDRVTLDLGETAAGKEPTDARLRAHQAGTEDPALYALLFHYGRYLAISASRPGTQAMNLQGIWSDRLYAPWGCNYTTNINTEMNYWPMLPCHLAELSEPLVALVRELSVNGERTAHRLYHAPGWVCHHNTDIWRQTFPAKGRAKWGMWPLGGAWLFRQLFEIYRYTLDEAFLRETAYPILRGCAEFLLSQLVPDEEGKLVLCPATSPENEYLLADGSVCAVSVSTAMNQSIIRDTFENTLACTRILGVDTEWAQQLADALHALRSVEIGEDGRILEWHEAHTEAEPDHRHVSHLFALFPAGQITPEDTPELAQACKRTLEARGDNGTGWSLGWKINFWACLRDGDRALKLLDQQLRFISEAENPRKGGGTYANMFDAHPPFQIDGNFGAANGIAQMLLQEHHGRLYLLPALPAAWKDGSVCGLCAPRRIEVTLHWRDGRLEEAFLRSDVDQTVEIVVDQTHFIVQITDGSCEWKRSPND